MAHCSTCGTISLARHHPERMCTPGRVTQTCCMLALPDPPPALLLTRPPHVSLRPSVHLLLQVHGPGDPQHLEPCSARNPACLQLACCQQD